MERVARGKLQPDGDGYWREGKILGGDSPKLRLTLVAAKSNVLLELVSIII